MKPVSCGVTFVPLHVGHVGFAFSRSEMVMIRSNGFLHFSHMNSYRGIEPTLPSSGALSVAGHCLRLGSPTPRLLEIEAHGPLLPAEWEPDPPIQGPGGGLGRPPEVLRVVAILEH